ncbi:MAG: DUF2073 domain-containing protein [Candidatus Aenigmatarchaeota archaeon]
MNLKIKFVPYEKFRHDGFKRLLGDLKGNTIILVDAKLNAEEEARLIKDTMEKVSTSFTGIEMSSLELEKQPDTLDKIKNMLIETISGKKRGLTIIGPAKIVRRIEKNPEELLLHM